MTLRHQGQAAGTGRTREFVEQEEETVHEGVMLSHVEKELRREKGEDPPVRFQSAV